MFVTFYPFASIPTTLRSPFRVLEIGGGIPRAMLFAWWQSTIDLRSLRKVEKSCVLGRPGCLRSWLNEDTSFFRGIRIGCCERVFWLRDALYFGDTTRVHAEFIPVNLVSAKPIFYAILGAGTPGGQRRFEGEFARRASKSDVDWTAQPLTLS